MTKRIKKKRTCEYWSSYKSTKKKKKKKKNIKNIKLSFVKLADAK